TLLRFGERLAAPAVLYPQGDQDLLAVSRHRDALARHYRFALPSAELVEDLVDKLRFAALAERGGLPVPATRCWRRGEPGSFDWQRFPCVVKPASRIEWFGSPLQRSAAGGTQKAILIESALELARLAPLLEQHETDFVIQEAVPGGEEQIVSYHAYVRPDGSTVAEFTGRKRRTAPRTYGLSSFVEITDDPEVRRAGREVLDRLALHGVAKLDFKRHPETGELFLLEINPRFTLWHYPAALAGVNIPLLVYRDLTRGARPIEPVLSGRPGVCWVNVAQDLRALRQYRAAGEITLSRWIAEVTRAEAREDLLGPDPLPGLLEALGTIQRMAARALAYARHLLPAGGSGRHSGHPTRESGHPERSSRRAAVGAQSRGLLDSGAPAARPSARGDRDLSIPDQVGIPAPGARSH
ncbi:MAG: ATP-grasp domain-containing protein, partial [Deltaproteobacteria bacterium]|nr:ATP-grasp domain-containing protein [Deltaproteobacteria bacterium]